MRNPLISIVLLLIANWTLSQEQQPVPTSFTLEEAIEFALQNNYSAINADRDILDAHKQKWETIADGLPQVDGNVSYQNQLKQPVSLLPGEIIGGEPGTFVPVTFGQPQQLSATATLTQQIFDGSYIVGVQATKSFLSYSANNQEKTDLEVQMAVVEAYGNVLLSKETMAILESNISTLEKNLFESTKLYENGLGEEENVEQLQITLSSLENEFKNAQRYEKITLQMFNLVMGLNIEHPSVLTEDLSALTTKEIDPELLNANFNIENNVDYKLALNLNEQRYYEHKLARSRALPTLDAFVNYGSSSFSDKFNFLGSDSEWFDSSILGFDLRIPIFSSLKRDATTQRARIALEKAATQLTEAKEQIRLQVQRAKSDYQFTIEQYGTAKKNLALAEHIEQKNQIKYAEGLASSFDLRQAQVQLYTTQQEYLQSMVDVINKKTELETILNNDSNNTVE